MPDLREVFEMVTKQIEPDLDSWKEQEDRQRSRSRNRSVGAIVVAAAVAIRCEVFALLSRPGSRHDLSNGTADAERPVRDDPLEADSWRRTGQPAPPVPVVLRGSTSSFPDGTTLAYMSAGYVHTVRVDGSDDELDRRRNANKRRRAQCRPRRPTELSSRTRTPATSTS